MKAEFEKLLQPYSIEPASLLPAIFNIFGLWHLSGQEQMTLLGLSNEKTFYNWKKQPAKAKLSRDLLERASYILGIYEALQILFPDKERSDQWLRSPNDNPLFDGSAPLGKMLGGFVVDLAMVREFLESQLSE
ncbi:MbcA/ParS/Xre antitoxin family protein [Haliea salexigens]|jgi:hypothetical protein|uniref:MbcA/ParS/Xre antitoxin family protein n=1 Tax=Haliea salexigens TaxID=287487 RepID=UPI0039E2235A|tara:strand:+ start:3643 stop:4041 length:399 start_codon:yes stop_codon:yes gene_type:complete